MRRRKVENGTVDRLLLFLQSSPFSRAILVVQYLYLLYLMLLLFHEQNILLSFACLNSIRVRFAHESRERPGSFGGSSCRLGNLFVIRFIHQTLPRLFQQHSVLHLTHMLAAQQTMQLGRPTLQTTRRLHIGTPSYQFL